MVVCDRLILRTIRKGTRKKATSHRYGTSTTRRWAGEPARLSVALIDRSPFFRFDVGPSPNRGGILNHVAYRVSTRPASGGHESQTWSSHPIGRSVRRVRLADAACMVRPLPRR